LKKGYKERKDKEDDISSYWIALSKGKVLELESASTRLNSVKKSLWKRVWTGRKKYYIMSES